MEPSRVAYDIASHSAGFNQFRREAWEQFFQDLPAAGKQPMCVDALRNATALLPHRWKSISFQQSYPFKVIREHARGEKAGHASTDHDGVFSVPVSRHIALIYRITEAF